MTVIDFKAKLNYQRAFRPLEIDGNNEDAVNRQFESDRGRIINSAAIRRLQQKTQVFPLEQNSAVRSRLTHSLEVQQVGRYIAKTILSELKQKKLLQEYHLDERIDAFESVVEMACLMHDIGNPPFGHFGEAAIQKWFETLLAWNVKSATCSDKLSDITVLNLTGDEKIDNLCKSLRHDLCQFEGNAQGIRMAHNLLKLNLTYAQIGGILKYTRPAYRLDNNPKEFQYIMKKPGYYWSEYQFIEQVRDALSLGEFCRYPLSYIMEAADDISYCIADLDDAIEKDIFTVDQLMAFLRHEWKNSGEVKSDDLFSKTVEKAYAQLNKDHHRNIQDQFFMYLRVFITGKLVPYTAQRFLDNLDAVYNGTFNHALLEDKSAEHRLLETLKAVAFKHVFKHSEVEELELQGFHIINGLLDFYQPLLMMSREDFTQLEQTDCHKSFIIETRLLHKLSHKQRAAYREAVDKITSTNEREFDIKEFYFRARLIQDYISGMTDHYAYQEYRKFAVCN